MARRKPGSRRKKQAATGDMVAGALILHDLPVLPPDYLELKEEVRRELEKSNLRSYELLKSVGLHLGGNVLVVPRPLVKEAERVIREVRREYKRFPQPVLTPRLALIALTRGQMAKVVDFVAEDVVEQLEYTLVRVGDALIKARQTSDEGELQKLKKEVLVLMEDWRSRYRIARMLGIDLDDQAQELEELAGAALSHLPA
jgi:hypothetical protein